MLLKSHGVSSTVFPIIIFVHRPSTKPYFLHRRSENTEGAIKNGQFRETGKIGYTRQTKQMHNKIRAGHHYFQTNTNNVNKTRVLLQTTRGKDEPNIVFMRKS